MAKKSKDDFLTQAIETAVSMAAQSTERIADLLPADLFAAVQPPDAQPATSAIRKHHYDLDAILPPKKLTQDQPNEFI